VMWHTMERHPYPLRRCNLQVIMNQRTDAMVNGALIALGALGIVDNVVFYWILALHRAVPGPHALEVEVGLVAVSAGMLSLGIWRERQSRKEHSRFCA
jgi:hypothetical protein